MKDAVMIFVITLVTSQYFGGMA